MRRLVRRLLLRDCDGFTLTEMLVTLTLTGVVLSAAYLLLISVGTMADSVEARSVAAEEARLVFDRLTRELRQAQELSEGEGVFESAQPRHCAFYSDLDHDGVPERVTYYVQGKSVYRAVAQATTVVPPFEYGPDGASELLVESLKGGWNGNVFEYYTNENPPEKVPAGRPEDVSAVEVRLVNAATVNRKTAYVDSSTWVKIRSVHNTVD